MCVYVCRYVCSYVCVVGVLAVNVCGWIGGCGCNAQYVGRYVAMYTFLYVCVLNSSTCTIHS